MLQIVQKELLIALSKTDKLKIRGMPRIMVYLFLVTLVFSMWLFLYAWCENWKATGKPDLVTLISFIACITSLSFMGSVGFFGKALIDKDNDGIPDEWEGTGGNNNDAGTISK